MEKAASSAARERGKPPGVPGAANAAGYSGDGRKGQETAALAARGLADGRILGLFAGLFAFGLECGKTHLECFVLFAGKARHFLDGLEFLALYHIEVAQNSLGLA